MNKNQSINTNTNIYQSLNINCDNINNNNNNNIILSKNMQPFICGAVTVYRTKEYKKEWSYAMLRNFICGACFRNLQNYWTKPIECSKCKKTFHCTFFISKLCDFNKSLQICNLCDLKKSLQNMDGPEILNEVNCYYPCIKTIIYNFYQTNNDLFQESFNPIFYVNNELIACYNKQKGWLLQHEHFVKQIYDVSLINNKNCNHHFWSTNHPLYDNLQIVMINNLNAGGFILKKFEIELNEYLCHKFKKKIDLNEYLLNHLSFKYNVDRYFTAYQVETKYYKNKLLKKYGIFFDKKIEYKINKLVPFKKNYQSNEGKEIMEYTYETFVFLNIKRKQYGLDEKNYQSYLIQVYFFNNTAEKIITPHRDMEQFGIESQFDIICFGDTNSKLNFSFRDTTDYNIPKIIGDALIIENRTILSTFCKHFLPASKEWIPSDIPNYKGILISMMGRANHQC